VGAGGLCERTRETHDPSVRIQELDELPPQREAQYAIAMISVEPRRKVSNWLTHLCNPKAFESVKEDSVSIVNGKRHARQEP
jgi:hypothetical protein